MSDMVTFLRNREDNINKNMESSQDKFKRIAAYRVKKILNSIRILGNCANKRAYSYSDDQVEKVFDAIIKQAESTKAKFGEEKKIDFEL